MREQVPAVLPPSEKKKPSINSGKREENRDSLLHSSRENRKWMALENKSAENSRIVPACGKDQKVEKKTNALLPLHLQKIMKEKVKEEDFSSPETTVVMAARKEQQENVGPVGDLAKERMMGNPSSSREGVVLLQWGHRKRPRCSRADNHLKHSSLTDESSVLSRKMVRVKAEKVSVVREIAHKGELKVKNGMAARVPNLMPELHTVTEEGRKRAKIVRRASELGKLNRGAPSGVKVACSQAPSHKKDTHLPHYRKMCISPGHNKASPDRSAVANAGCIEIFATKSELDWPKILISLSHKEKEDDFLILKGTKLPQRPKRRPKAVEKALHFCSPGSWLTDLTQGRYDVKEKKCAKRRLRGLKAMESMDSDSE